MLKRKKVGDKEKSSASKTKPPALKSRSAKVHELINKKNNVDEENEKMYKALKKAGMGKLAEKLNNETKMINEIIYFINDNCNIIDLPQTQDFGLSLLNIIRKYTKDK